MVLQHSVLLCYNQRIMSLSPVKIPQNVYVEDRIFGPVSLRQLIILMVGGGVSYGIWSLVKSANGGSAGMVLTAICWSPAVLAAAFAFVKIQSLSMLKLCLLLTEKAQKPSKRTWAPRKGIDISTIAHKPSDEIVKKTVKKKPQSSEKIDELSAILDSNPYASSSTTSQS